MPDRSPFLFDSDVVFSNHGSFGAVPSPVFDELPRLQLERERQPVRRLARDVESMMATARSRLSRYVGGDADDMTDDVDALVDALRRLLPQLVG